MSCLVMVYLGKTREGARQTFGPRVNWYYRTIAKYVAPPKGQQAIYGYEAYGEARDLASSVEFEDLVNGPSVICEEPEHCIEKLITQVQDFGFNELLCWTRIGGLEN